MNILSVISQAVYCFYRHLHERKYLRAAACASLVAVFTLPYSASATIVRMVTNLGSFNVELYDTEAPITVTNFLYYVNKGDYSGTVIHRSVPGFVIQGGGYVFVNSFIQYFYDFKKNPPIQNEFSPSRSNVRGTIAMAKQTIQTALPANGLSILLTILRLSTTPIIAEDSRYLVTYWTPE